MKFEKGRERRGQQQRTMKSITVKKRKKLRASQQPTHGLAAADSADVIMSGENKKQNFPTHFFGTCFFFFLLFAVARIIALPSLRKKEKKKEVRGLFELGRQRQFGFNLPNGEE